MPSSVHTACRLAAAVLLTTAVTWMLVPDSTRIRAQSVSAGLPYPARLTPERAAAFSEAALRGLDYLPGEVVVKLRPDIARIGQQRAVTALRSRPGVSSLRWSGDIVVLADARVPDAHALSAELSREPGVAWAHPNYLSRARLEPNDPGFADLQWNLRAVDVPRAWDINPGAGDTVTIAVVDSGITSVTSLFSLPTWNGNAIQTIDVPVAVSPDFTVERLVDPVDLVFWEGPVIDFEGHGTHVAGTVGQDTNNGLGLAGIAYNARIMPIKACLSFWDLQFFQAGHGVTGSPPLDAGGCPDDAVAAGIRLAADNGAKVINLSLGGFGTSPVLKEALEYAVGKGAFVTLAAGNGFEEGNAIEIPAVYAGEIDGAMSVAAVGRSGTRAYYSAVASHVEIAAPGGDIRDGGLSGLVWQSSLVSSDFTPGAVQFPRFDRYTDTPSQGTSMAAPHVAGIAALLISQGVTNPAAVEALIKATALDLGASGRDDEYGYGLIQPRTALRGFGLLGAR